MSQVKFKVSRYQSLASNFWLYVQLKHHRVLIVRNQHGKQKYSIGSFRLMEVSHGMNNTYIFKGWGS